MRPNRWGIPFEVPPPPPINAVPAFEVPEVFDVGSPAYKAPMEMNLLLPEPLDVMSDDVSSSIAYKAPLETNLLLPEPLDVMSDDVATSPLKVPLVEAAFAPPDPVVGTVTESSQVDAPVEFVPPATVAAAQSNTGFDHIYDFAKLLGPGTPTPVTWENIVNCAAVADELTKNAGGTAWNAGATSVQTAASGGISVEFTVASTTHRIMCGLSNGNTGSSYTEIDFAFYCQAGGVVQVYENGADKGVVGAFTPATVFKVTAQAGVVTYYLDGVLVYTSGSAPVYPLLVDCSFYESGGVISTCDMRVHDADVSLDDTGAATAADLSLLGTWTHALPTVTGTNGSFENVTNDSAGNRLETAAASVDAARTAEVFYEGIWQLPTTPTASNALAVVGGIAAGGHHSILSYDSSAGNLVLHLGAVKMFDLTVATDTYLLDPTYVAIWWDHANTVFRAYVKKAGEVESTYVSASQAAGSAGADRLYISGEGVTWNTCKMKVHAFGIKRGAMTLAHRSRVYEAMGI